MNQALLTAKLSASKALASAPVLTAAQALRAPRALSAVAAQPLRAFSSTIGGKHHQSPSDKNRPRHNTATGSSTRARQLNSARQQSHSEQDQASIKFTFGDMPPSVSRETQPAPKVAENTDPYLTRDVSAWTIVDRADPVVYPPSPSVADNPKLLTEEQVEQFDRDGFIVLPNVFSEEEVAQLRAEVHGWRDELQEQMDDEDCRVTDEVKFVTEPTSKLVRSIFEPHKRNGLLSSTCTAPRLVHRAQQLLGDDVYIHQSRINFQPSFVGTGFWWHSDFETWHAEDGMPRTRALSCVTMIDRNTEANGSLMVVPGSHKHFIQCPGSTPQNNWERSLKEKQFFGTPNHESLEKMIHRYGIKHCTGEPGSVTIFDSNLLHGSHNNISADPRCNLFQVFNACSNKLKDPYYGPSARPEHIAARDPQWTKPL